MSEQHSDLELVELSIKALEHLPKQHKQFPSEAEGVVHLHDAGPLVTEYSMMCLMQDALVTPLKNGRFENGTPLTEEVAAGLRAAIDARETANPWAVLPWGMERLSKLLMRHVEDAVYAAPHVGFHGPTAGHSHLAHVLVPATAVDWLLYCPQRCRLCKAACRRDLERLRRALLKEAADRKHSDPTVFWTRREGGGAVVVSSSLTRCELKREQADLFEAVAERSPEVLRWADYRTHRLGVAEARVKSRSARMKTAQPSPRMALRDDSIRRTGNRVEEKLGLLKHYWHQDSQGASWNPPPGSGRRDD